ncbi:MAG: L,D-transpeptidase [Chloroflexi bacterium]|nr:L,D-transpeptidase [Chloroflexota bacterium]
MAFPDDLLPSRLSRRDFLKLAGLGLLGLALPAFNLRRVEMPPDQQGRVAYDYVDLYAKPSFDAKRLTRLWHDQVVPIAAVVIGAEKPAYNRLWYYVPQRGYVHSGGVQPVRVELNSPQEIPEGGVLAEVTVPFTDVYRSVERTRPPVYRLYYATTHWVVGLVKDASGQAWYRIEDDKWKETYYYAPARHIRILKPSDVAPLSPHVPPEEKRIRVDLTHQIVTAYEGGRAVYAAKTATGMGYFGTPVGEFRTFHKRPYRHMAAGNRAEPDYDLPGIPWVCYITENGISFHGTYWHNDFGKPRSHGCLNLSPTAAKWIYRWTLPVVPFHEQYAYKKNGGTLVEIHQ